jgi:predicted transcriptional regulator
MNNKQPNLECRRDRIVELYSEGRNQSQIAQILKISQPTVSRDLQYQRRPSELLCQVISHISVKVIIFSQFTSPCFSVILF